MGGASHPILRRQNEQIHCDRDIRSVVSTVNQLPVLFSIYVSWGVIPVEYCNARSVSLEGGPQNNDSSKHCGTTIRKMGSEYKDSKKILDSQEQGDVSNTGMDELENEGHKIHHRMERLGPVPFEHQRVQNSEDSELKR